MHVSRLTLLAWGIVLPLMCAAPVAAQALLTQSEALALAFPGADGFERQTAFLSPEQVALVNEATGRALDRSVVTYYSAMRGATAVGIAYFDVHRVRTLNEVLMVAVGVDETVVRVEVVAFSEPPEYRAPNGWLRLFQGSSGESDLSAKGDVPNITGATLTARAVKAAVERVLALHRVIAPPKTAADR